MSNVGYFIVTLMLLWMYGTLGSLDIAALREHREKWSLDANTILTNMRLQLVEDKQPRESFVLVCHKIISFAVYFIYKAPRRRHLAAEKLMNVL